MKIIIVKALSILVLMCAGCATPSMYEYSPDQLQASKHIALIRLVSDEKIYVVSRRFIGKASSNIPKHQLFYSLNFDGDISVNNGNIFDRKDYARDHFYNSFNDFNAKVGRNIKPELDKQLFLELERGLTRKNLRVQSLSIDRKTAYQFTLQADGVEKFVDWVKRQCTNCDTALVIDPGFGMGGFNGLTAQTNTDISLITLSKNDPVVLKGVSNIIFSDKGKRYPYYADALADAPNAVKALPAMVDQLAAAILNGTKGR